MQQRHVPPSDPPPYRSSKIAVALRAILSIGLLSSGVAVFVMLGQAEVPQQQTSEEQSTAVQIAVAREHTSGISFTVDGVVRPFRDVQVAAESAGRVVMKADNCRVGRSVSEGDVLIKVDPRDYELDVRRLEKELEQAVVSADELEVQVENVLEQIHLAEQTVELAQRELERVQRINVRGAVTDSEIDAAKRELLGARTALQTQRDQYRVLEVSRGRLVSVIDRTRTQLESAKLALERCDIPAPIGGVVTEEHVEQGGYVQRAAAVFTVRDTARLDVRCSLRAEQLAWIWESQTGSSAMSYEFPATPVTVIYEVGHERFAWDGVLTRYDGAGLDSQTRMAPCLVHVNAPQEVRQLQTSTLSSQHVPPTLMVGMFVQVQIDLEPRVPLLNIPVSALHPGNRVWIVDAGRLRSATVRIADSTPDEVLVYVDPDSVAAGDQVVVSPLASPVAGEAVHLVDAS